MARSVEKLALLDWKRRIFALYAKARADADSERAWHHWCDARDELYRTHPQSPRPGGVPSYFPYDVFLPFRDGTSGRDTYGAGRCLLDTVKGADLGGRDETLVLDFNFAFTRRVRGTTPGRARCRRRPTRCLSAWQEGS
jgi:hypothetical protein